MDFLDCSYFCFEVFCIGDEVRLIKLLASSLKTKIWIDVSHVYKTIKADKYRETMYVFSNNLEYKIKKTIIDNWWKNRRSNKN